MSISRASQTLTVFVTLQFINISALFANYLIMKLKLPAISDISAQNPIIGASIILFECISPISLGMHFFYSYQESRV